MTTVHLNTIHEREEELRIAQKERNEFELLAKRDQMVAKWAAGIFGYHGEDAKRYIRDVIIADLEEPGDEDIIRKLITDFDDHGIAISRQEIEKQLLIAEQALRTR
ncbi:ATPase inhibitor subunit zeta [Candidatus Odyssella thessalonicensis]|uniref:ATPase inhibitor subunit zeta n=1 Tax=Candidatus Odyssella thessalonicensis TaxID=84647 RepID=UPI000225BB0C|nr:ATPase inhibitor subunit zeta [Candidatus Odyssella thessalonicensis]